MILNNLVFCIDENKKFVNGSIPSGKITANDINSNFLYVITPSPIKTLLRASFQNEMQNETPETMPLKYVGDKIKVDELVPKTAQYYELVKDWNVFVSNIPEKSLEMISYSRAGTIGVSFNFTELLVPEPPEDVVYSGDILTESFVPNADGYYVVKLPQYFYKETEFNYNDMLVKNGNSFYKKKSVKVLKNTNTLRYSIDPSVYNESYEPVDSSVLEFILLSISELNQKVDALIIDSVPIDNETIVKNTSGELMVSPELKIDGGFL